MWALWLLGTALAGSGLADPRAGAWADVHAGLGVGGAPFTAGFGSDASAGVWVGRYDPDYALGRYLGAGLGLRTGPDGLVAGMVEVRRGVDLLIVGLHGFGAAGWDFGGSAPLVEVGLGVKARVRPTGRFVGWEVRLRGGAEFADVVHPVGALTLGASFAGPWRRSAR